MQGHDEQAIEAFRRSLELDPTDPLIQVGLAWAWARVGERDSALAALEAFPAEASLIKEIAIVYGELGDLDTAYEYLYDGRRGRPGQHRHAPHRPLGRPAEGRPPLSGAPGEGWTGVAAVMLVVGPIYH